MTPRCQEFSGRGLLAGGPGMGSLRTGRAPGCVRRRGGFPLGPSGWRRCLPGKPLVDRWRRLGSTHGWRAMAGRSARKYRKWKQNHPSHGGQFARGATPEGAADGKWRERWPRLNMFKNTHSTNRMVSRPRGCKARSPWSRIRLDGHATEYAEARNRQCWPSFDWLQSPQEAYLAFRD